MSDIQKLLIAGVGGQGVVWLTELLVEASVRAGIPVASSEVHGISQRRGSVVAGIAIGSHASGLVEEGEADFLIGLEPLEAMRCLAFLHAGSRAVIDDNRVLPHAVNRGTVDYPNVGEFIEYLRINIRQVICNKAFDAELPPVLRNVFIIGRATQLEGFPLSAPLIKGTLANMARPGYENETHRAFDLGRSNL